MLVLAYLACAAAWGTTWYGIRRSLPGFPPAPGVAIRFLLAAAVLWTILFARGEARTIGRRWKVVAVAGLLNAVAYALIYEAERRITGGLAAVLYATMPLVMALLTAGLRIEPVRARQVAGALAGVAGIWLLFRDELAAAGAAGAGGVALVLLSVVCAASHAVLVKRRAPEVGALAVTTIFATVTGVAMLAAWPILFRAQTVRWDAAAAASLVYLALVGTVLAFVAYFFLLRHVKVMTISTLVLVTPVVALVVDAAAGERALTLRGLLGPLVVLAGVGLGFGRIRREAPPGDPRFGFSRRGAP
jgi:drug/metabolite transporter (DMT)-like permease